LIATDKSDQEHIEEIIQENRRIKHEDVACKLEISKEGVGHIVNLLGFRKFLPGGSHEN
jgi:hypothetical protein